MNIRDLKYLIALAQHRHFGKAAQASFVSQPALSMQIKKLENTLGVQLLERTNKSVMLTSIGEIIAERSRDILQQTEEIYEIAKLAKDPYSGELKLGIIPTLAPYLLPNIIPQLTRSFTKVKFFLVENQTAVLMEKIKLGIIDAAILAFPIIGSNLITQPLFEEEFLLAVPHEHPFADKNTIKQTELKKQTLLLLEEGHCMREQSLDVCHFAKAIEHSNFQATSLETLRHMVAAGVGITLMPKLAYRPNDGIRYIPFANPKPLRSIGISWRNTTAKKALLLDITAQIRKFLAEEKVVT